MLQTRNLMRQAVYPNLPHGLGLRLPMFSRRLHITPALSVGLTLPLF